MNNTPEMPSWAATAVVTTVLAAAYFIAGKLALLLAIPPGYATAVWPSSGIALAGLLLYGYRCWPGVWVGSFLVNLGIAFDASSAQALASSLAVAGGIAGGAALQAGASAWLVKRWVGFPSPLTRADDVLRFFALGALAGCLVNATIGPLVLLVAGTLPAANWLNTAFTWWVGDVIGILTFAPLVLIALGKPRALWRKRIAGVALPLVAVFAVMTVWFGYTSALEDGAQRSRFEERARTIADAVEGQSERHLEVLNSFVMLFEIHQQISRADFAAFAEQALARHSNIRAREWIPRVQDSKRAAFEREARRHVDPGYHIREGQAGGLVAAATRTEYFPVYYVAPTTDNLSALGFDLGSEAVRAAALQRARTSRQTAASSRLVLVQERHQGYGVLVVAPVWGSRAPASELLGYAAAVFQIDDLFAAAIKLAATEGIAVRLIDESASADDQLLLGTAGAQAGTDASPMRWSHHIAMADRTWRIEFAPTPQYLSAQDTTRPWTAFTLGLLFTGLLGIGLLVQSGHVAATEEAVAERTAALADANARLAERERFLRLVFEASPSAMIMVDGNGRIVMANAQTEILFGYTGSELVGQPIEMLMPERYRSKHVILRDKFGGAQSARTTGVGQDLYGLRKDGSEFPVEIGLNPVRTDKGRFVVSAIVDISERKQAKALRQAVEALERSNLDLQRFAYIASHDLQTPMRNIASFAGLLRDTYADKLDPQANDWIRRIVESIKQLQILIRDLLDYSRVDSQAHPFELLPMRSLVEDAKRLLESAIRNSAAEVSCGELPALMGDRSQLVQLMLNLIGNAIKYRGGAPPRIHVSAERQGGEWRFAVRDNGIGIAPKYHEKIFDIFQRLHDQRVYPGTGIGLALCRRVVHRHGGNIRVESEVGQGSTFYFTIPASTETEL